MNDLPIRMKLDIWDTTGNEAMANLIKPLFAGAHAVIFVYSIES